MNNLLSFWLAPVTAFFFPGVYCDAARSRGTRGILYNLYLAGLVTVFIMGMLVSLLVSGADEFMIWLRKDLPVLTWTPEGLSMKSDVLQPYTLVHPVHGPIAVFDMKKTTVTDAEMGKFPIVVTASKIFYKRTATLIEERDITQAGFQAQQRQQRLPSKVQITGDIVYQTYQNLKRALFFILPLVFLIIFFIFFLLSSLFYSLAGLLFNRMRKNRLGYGAVYNLTCFALTASLVLSWIIKSVPMAWFWGVLINLGYMFFAFKVSDPETRKIEST